MDIGWCFMCGKQVFDTNALYCGSECANLETKLSVKNVPLNTSSPSSPPNINLRFSIAITPNIYHASESNARAFSPPSSASSSYTESYLSSSLTSVSTLDKCYICNKPHNYQKNCDEVSYDDYSYYSTSNPIDIPSPRTKNDSKITDKPIFGFGQGSFGKKIDF